MQRHPFFKILIGFANVFFMIPAVVLRGITVASHHCNCRNAVQQKRARLRSFIIIILASIFITQKTNAQTRDTNYVDTTSMKNARKTLGYDSAESYADTAYNIDSVAPVTAGNEGYDDNDEGYEDTTIKHIYDTSKYFFNWKEYVNDRYTKEKIAQRHLIDADIKALKSQDDFWYIPVIEKMERRLKTDPKYRDSLMNIKNHELKDANEDSMFMQPWFNLMLWIIIIGIFVAAIIYFLSQNKISIFSREAASSADEESENDQEDIFHLSYSKLIQKAEKDKDFRVAIRLMFLQTLKLLSDTNAIQYQPDYTNLHYLQQLNQSKFYTEFSKLSRNYEYAWYGKFDISAERYATIKNDFIKLQNRIT